MKMLRTKNDRSVDKYPKYPMRVSRPSTANKKPIHNTINLQQARRVISAEREQ